MKGLIYKNYLITRKYYFMAFVFSFITALFMILIRLSMICGNISQDAEAVSELSRSMWIFRYMPCAVIILGFAGYGEAFFTDLNAGWTRFSRTTSLSTHQIVGSYFLSEGIVLVFAYIMCLLYLTIFCLSFGDKISLNYIANITSDLEKIADMVTFIDKGKILLTGGKDETVENHAVIKCKKDDYKNIDTADIVSARITDFGAEVMIHDRKKCEKKYSGLTIDNTTLEEIMLYYVRREKKEWK